MVLIRLRQFANKKGWKIDKNCVYGEENGYLFTLFDGNGFKAVLTPLTHIDDQKKKIIIDYLDENRKRLKLWNYQFSNDVLVMKFSESFISTKSKTMEILIRDLTEFLNAQDIPGKNYCIICGQDKANEIVNISDIYYYIHDLCRINLESELESARTQFDSERKNYFRGFVGAILGGIVCSIPWIMVQVFFSKVAAVLAYLIGFGAYKAYMLFKGKLGRATKWIVSVAVIFSVVLTQIITISIELIKADIALTYHNYQLLFTNPETIKMLRANLGLSLFMALLGILPIFFGLKGTAKSCLPTVKKE